jgi:hypothetical protein
LKKLDTKIIFNIGKCLFCLGRTEEALIMTEIVCQEEKEKILLLANCYNKLGQRDVAEPLFSFVLANREQLDQMSAIAHLINCGETSTEPSEPYAGKYFLAVSSLQQHNLRRWFLFKRLMILYPKISKKYDCHIYTNCQVDYFDFKIAAISKLKHELVKNSSVCDPGFDQQDLC